MALCRLIYASRAVELPRPEDIDAILGVSRANNAKVGVTGALMYSSREFLQCLEGAREAVNSTYARIIKDPRHTEVTILEFSEIERRWFAGWGMHHVPPLWSTRQMLLRYAERETFNPLKMSAACARAMLSDLATDLGAAREDESRVGKAGRG
ncbi:MAG: BLUF domain-containing protein [Lysobacterales bacterium]